MYDAVVHQMALWLCDGLSLVYVVVLVVGSSGIRVTLVLAVRLCVGLWPMCLYCRRRQVSMAWTLSVKCWRTRTSQTTWVCSRDMDESWYVVQLCICSLFSVYSRVSKVRWPGIAVCNTPHLCGNSRAIWDQCYLPPGRGDIPAFTFVGPKGA